MRILHSYLTELQSGEVPEHNVHRHSYLESIPKVIARILNQYSLVMTTN